MILNTRRIAGVVQRLEFQPSKLAMWVRFPSPAPESDAKRTKTYEGQDPS